MRKLLIITLCLLCVLPARGADPKGEPVYNKVSRSYTLNPDGSVNLRVIKELTYYSYASSHGLFSKTIIDYDPAFQELIINASYTKLPDGETAMTPETAFVEALPDYAADAPAYSGLRRMVVAHNGLEPGARVYLDYTVITKEGYLPELDIAVPLYENSPITDYSISVTVPDNKEVRYASTVPVADPLVTTDGILKTYAWNLKNVQAAPSDPGKYEQEILEATTFASFEDAFSFISSQFAKPEDLDSSVISAVSTLGAAPNKIEAVDKYLSEHLVVVPVPLRAASYRIRSAGAILASACATRVEYASLRSALLESQGLEVSLSAGDDKTAGIASVDEITALASFEKSNTKKVNKYRIELEYRSHQLRNGYLVVTLPFARGAFDGRPYSSYPGNRTRPLILDKPVNEEYEYVITLGPGITVQGPAALEKEISNNAGCYGCHFSMEGNKLIVKRSVEVFWPKVIPAFFEDFRAVMSEWSVPCTLILKN